MPGQRRILPPLRPSLGRDRTQFEHRPANLRTSLVGMYFKTPSMTRDDGIRPSQEGTAPAKDICLVGVGLTLLS